MSKYFLNDSSAESCADGATGFDMTTTQGTPTTQITGNVSTDGVFTEEQTYDVTVGAGGISGDYDISLDVNNVSAAVLTRFRLQRLNSSCAVQESSSYSSEFLNTGTHTETISFSPTWAAGDVLRLSIEIARQIGAHGNKNITVDQNDTLSFVDDLQVSASNVPAMMQSYRQRR